MGIDASARIHDSAVIEDGASIGPDCEIGPFCVVGRDVTLAEGVVLKSHAVVTGWTEIGAESVIFPFANIGDVPQGPENTRARKSRLIVGRRNRHPQRA